MDFKSAFFNELNTRQLYDILQLRAAVFIVEQDCVYQDIDGKDFIALHLYGAVEDKIRAYARIFAPGDYFKECSIGRVVVHQEHRASGLGKSLMNAAIREAEKHFNPNEIALSAQTYLVRFYEDLGFLPVGEAYLEDGIPHIKMMRTR